MSIAGLKVNIFENIRGEGSLPTGSPFGTPPLRTIELPQSSEVMADMPTQMVEFYGGPLDGHQTCLCVSSKPFLVIKTLTPVPSSDSLNALYQALLWRHDLQPFVLAVYELRLRHDLRIRFNLARYQYLRSSIATEVALAPLLVDAMVQDADQSLRPMVLNDDGCE